MSFYNDASLIFLPSGGAGKDGKAYSIKPTNGDGDFTFSRGSNLTATRVDSNGLIEKGRENLLTQSNNFSDSDWNTTSGSSFEGGQSGYDGSSDAWLFTDSGAVLGYGAYQDKVVNGVHTYSIYVKEGSTSTFVIDAFQSPRPSVTIDLTNGNVTASNEIDAKSELISNGWYRLSLTFNASSTLYMRFGCNGAGSVYIQDAQLEIGLTSTEYIESGASTGLAGILEDSPRFDYSGGASCPNLLLEGSRTNLITQSEYFGGEFSLDNVSLDYNYGTSPEGVTNSALLTQTGSSSSNSMYEFNLPTTDGSYAYSFFFKAGTSTNCRMYVATGIAEDFNPQTITAGYSGGTLNILFEDYGDGWWRASATKTLSAASTNRFSIYPDRNNQGRNIEIWGAQVEQGSYPTSYIPNHSGGSVTREAESITQATSSFNIRGDYTFFFEVSRMVGYDSGNTPFITLNNTTDNSVLYFYNRDADKNIRFLIREGSTGGDSIYSPNDSFEIGERVKFCIRKDSTKTEVFFNGSSIGSTTNHKPDGFDNILNGFRLITMHQNLVFSSALPDNQCIALTS